MNKSMLEARDTVNEETFAPPVRVAMIGAGHMGAVNALGVRASGVAVVSHVLDRDVEAGSRLASKLGARYISDYDELLARSDVDAVFISVPHDILSSLAIKAAKARKHVIVEKPGAITLESLEALIAVCLAENVRLTSNYWLRYLPSVQLARKIVQAGALGDIVGVDIQDHQHKGPGYWSGAKGGMPDDWRALKSRSGGGMLIMTTCHPLDYFRYVTGQGICRVYSEYGTLASHIEVEDTLTMTFRCMNGAIGSLSTSSNMRGSRVEGQRIWGRQGTLVFSKDSLSFYSTRPILAKRPGRWHSYKFKGFEPKDGVAEVVTRFVQSIRTGQDAEISPLDIWSNLAIILSAYSSFHESRAVDVPFSRFDHLQVGQVGKP